MRQPNGSISLRRERLISALKRLDADNFGYCFKCGRPIPPDLLIQRPETLICTTCITSQ